MRANEFYQFGQQLGGFLKDRNLLPNLSPTGGPPAPRPVSTNRPPMPNLDIGKNAPGLGYDREAVGQVIDAYVNAGYDPEFATGMAANFVAESAMNPMATNEGEGAFGVGQWRLDRLDNLTAFANRYGMDMNSLQAQIQFSMHEFANAESAALGRIMDNNPQSAADYASFIDEYYERSDGSARKRRQDLATQIYTDFFGGERTGQTDTAYDADNFGDIMQFVQPEGNPLFGQPVAISGNLDGVDPNLIRMAQEAWGYVVPGGRIEVSTGVSSHSPTNHQPGHAIDFAVYDANGNLIPGSDERHYQAGMIFRSMGGHGVGYSTDGGYMRGTHAHWDISAHGPRSWNDSSEDGGWAAGGAADRGGDFLRADQMELAAVLEELGIDASNIPEGTRVSYSASEGQQSPTGGDPRFPTFQPPANRDTPYNAPSQPQTGAFTGRELPFNRYEGESDEEFRGRRRAMLLNAAEGFQSLSRGTQANYGAAVEQRLQERERAFRREFDVANADLNARQFDRQADRQERAQALQEQMFDARQRQSAFEQDEIEQRRDAIAGIAYEVGDEFAQTLTDFGMEEEAFDFIVDSETRRREREEASASAMSQESIDRFAGIADSMGLPAISEGIRSGDATTRQEAIQQLLQAEEPEDAAAQVNEVGFTPQQQELFDATLAALPEDTPQSMRDSFEQNARSAILQGSDGAFTNLQDELQRILEYRSPADKFFDARIESDIANMEQITSGQSNLMRAATEAMDVGSNPEFDSGALRAGWIAPIGRLVRDLPGGSEFMERFFDMDNVDFTGYRMLESLRNGSLGDLADGITGQLSNLEGDRILTRLASGEMGRTEILALSQMMRRSVQAQQAVFAAQQQYLEEAGDSANLTEYNEIATRVTDQFELIPDIHGGIDPEGNQRDANGMRQEMAISYLEEYGVEDPSQLPDHIKGMVVAVYGNNNDPNAFEIVPLFAEMFGNEYPNHAARE